MGPVEARIGVATIKARCCYLNRLGGIVVSIYIWYCYFVSRKARGTLVLQYGVAEPIE
jgi:hypothetical protein